MQYRHSSLVLWLAWCCVICGCDHSNKENESFDIGKMAGTWDFHHDATHEMAEYRLDDKGNLTGKGYIMYGTDTSYIEFFTITKTADGLVYSVSIDPSPASEKISYHLSSQSSNRLEFSNMNYPFPQVIVFQMNNDSNMVNYIEGEQGGERVRRNWIYQKIK